jgi:hypothetical protein
VSKPAATRSRLPPARYERNAQRFVNNAGERTLADRVTGSMPRRHAIDIGCLYDGWAGGRDGVCPGRHEDADPDGVSRAAGAEPDLLAGPAPVEPLRRAVRAGAAVAGARQVSGGDAVGDIHPAAGCEKQRRIIRPRGLYEHRIVVPGWITSDRAGTHWNAEAASRDNVGLRFWAYVTTGPLTLLTLANLFAAWTTSGAVRACWLASVVAVLADRILTFSYFIPTMVGLMNAPDSPASAATATRWVRVNYLRHALTLFGWLAALKALSLASIT